MEVGIYYLHRYFINHTHNATMALPRKSGSHQNIIDLTGADDDDSAHVGTSRRPVASSSVPLRPAVRHSNGPSLAAEASLPPPKRRRVHEPASPINAPERSNKASPTQEQIAAALGRCLESQVFPYIAAATSKLPQGLYDTDKLGASVVRVLVDKDFERHFTEGKGHLSAAAEGIVASRVHKIVTELSIGPEYRLTPPQEPPSPSPAIATATTKTAAVRKPSILPSIETDDHHIDHVDQNAHKIETPEPLVPSPKFKERPTPPKPKRSHERRGDDTKGKVQLSAATETLTLPERPYISAQARKDIGTAVANAVLPLNDSFPRSQLYHVDFSVGEVMYLQNVARKLYGRPMVAGSRTPLRDLRNILKKMPNIKDRLALLHRKDYEGHELGPPPTPLTKRSVDDIKCFLLDLLNKRLNPNPRSLFVEHAVPTANDDLSPLLLSREIWGDRVGGTARSYQNFRVTARSQREDLLEPLAEWAGGAGDIMTVSWLSNEDFVCGTTTHSDSHNQQYNKPGNLLLGSVTPKTLKAYPDHRIVRPIVSQGDNSLDSMVASQDPWLFTSVVSSDYDPTCDLAFTSSFDNTVKVWRRQEKAMTAIGTWLHGGRVNFVVASKNEAKPGVVATAADVPTEAVRVYQVQDEYTSWSQYDTYSCTRVHDEDYVASDKWAYYPAAIRWGLAPAVRHLLLIGYSPRSPTGEDHEIPEDKLKTGELCLWDTISKTQVPVTSAKTQNVFEVAWHPNRAVFAAATSASLSLEKGDQFTKTQIRIFEYKEGQYGAIKVLDCQAIDINEISIMPNSLLYSYVTASCTDGNVYVWDTARSDLPMCTLKHGKPIEELVGEREVEDIGVKFTAWGTTADRLYTGSSDGILKAWNIRHGGGVLVRNIIEAAGPITFGAFSPDFEKLVIGDGSGRVYLLALKDLEAQDPVPAGIPVGWLAGKLAGVPGGLTTLRLGGKTRAVRRPIPITPHPELPRPAEVEISDVEAADELLMKCQITLHPIAGAIQGPNYASTNLYRKEAHINDDPAEQRPQLVLPRQGQRQREKEAAVNSPILGSLTIWPRSDPDDIVKNLRHKTLCSLQHQKAELDDRLYELDYETSIADSEETESEEDALDKVFITIEGDSGLEAGQNDILIEDYLNNQEHLDDDYDVFADNESGGNGGEERDNVVFYDDFDGEDIKEANVTHYQQEGEEEVNAMHYQGGFDYQTKEESANYQEENPSILYDIDSLIETNIRDIAR
ncbi:WD40 repeat-like protein [Xylariaceae sp. FL0255]|nr:WD40 repeat-like protein [Xylariaceae sp. FL0255]